MEALRDFGRGLVASFAPQALAALGWIYGAALAVAFVFTLLVYRFVASTVTGSAMAEELRGGQSANWIVDLVGRPGTTSTIAVLGTTAMLLVVVYVVIAVFFSGGVIAKVRAALGHAGPERFLAASGRHVGPMARVAVVEIIVIAILAIVLFAGQAIGGFSGVANALAWGWLALTAFTLGLVMSVFDYARIRVVAKDERSGLDAIAAAVRFVGRRALPVVLITVVTGVLSLVVALSLVWVHSTLGLDTGAGVFLGIVVGQIGVIGRLWTRVVAYATETAFWERTSDE